MGKPKLSFLALVMAIMLTAGMAPTGYAMDVTLGWDANSETDLAGYKIYYGVNQGGPYNGAVSTEGTSPIIVPLTTLANPSGPQFTVHGLPDAIHYLE
jgi:hypothetical protein